MMDPGIHERVEDVLRDFPADWRLPARQVIEPTK
jgi:hypothetical protein